MTMTSVSLLVPLLLVITGSSTPYMTFPKLQLLLLPAQDPYLTFWTQALLQYQLGIGS